MFILIVIWNDCSIQDLLLIMAIWFSLCLANCISHFLQIIMRTDDNGNQLLQEKKKKMQSQDSKLMKVFSKLMHATFLYDSLFFSLSPYFFFFRRLFKHIYLFNWKFHQEGKFSVGPYRFNNTHPLKSIHVCDFRRSTNILKLKQTLFWTGKLFWIQYLSYIEFLAVVTEIQGHNFVVP